MKKIMMFVFVFAYCAFAEKILDQTACNMGSSQNSNPGIPAESCSITSFKIAPGTNTSLNGSSMFFFDQDVTANLVINGIQKNLPIRFVVYSDEKDYNTVQVLIQTAFASRSSLSVIFVNPLYKLLQSDSHLSNRACYINKDRDGNVININCPIQAIQIIID